MNLQQRMDGWFLAARSKRWLYWFAWFNRVALAVAFLPSGWKKVIGIRFTQIPISNPVGFFFEAMYRTGFYWNFLGWAQWAAALLILLPRTQALGAAIYLPIVLNIFLITLSMHFVGTPVVTGGMLLANLFLLCWHYDAWRPLVFPATIPRVGQAVEPAK